MAKIGIKDIAAKAGVSIATVSHAFRNPGRVSEQTRRKVLAAADEVGYAPNRLARSLRTARSGCIVAIIPDVADNHNSGIIKAIEKTAHARGYSVLLGDTQGSPQREREFAAMARSGQADGIILMSHRMPFRIGEGQLDIDELPPLVNGCEFAGYDELPMVGIDDFAAAVDAANHLIDLGHRHIALVTGDMATTSSRRRMDGFTRAMADAGIGINDRLVVYGEYTLGGGEAAARSLLMEKQRPSAIFCFSDEIALGCMAVLRERGFDVPGDISVIGFDNIPFARYVAPPLTTIAQPAADIGATCAALLLDLIDGKRPDKMRHVMPHELVVRKSTAPVSGGRRT